MFNSLIASDIKGTFCIEYVESDGLMLIESTVNGQSGYLIFDTGAEGLILNGVSDTEINPTQVYTTTNGELVTASLKTQLVSIGTFDFKIDNAVKTDLTSILNRFDYEILGIIGMNVFPIEALAIKPDFKAICFYYGSSPNPTTKQYQAYKLSNNEQLPIISIDLDNRAIDCLIDTGATISFIEGKLIKKQRISLSKEDKVNITSASGTSMFDAVSSEALQVNLDLNADAQLAVASLKESVDLDAILSFNDLDTDHVVFDFKKNQVFIRSN